jgi:valyl-tRNA synthetase
MGDTAFVKTPGSKYQHLLGKDHCTLVNRKVPLITDDYIDINFGTGALKATYTRYQRL